MRTYIVEKCLLTSTTWRLQSENQTNKKEGQRVKAKARLRKVRRRQIRFLESEDAWRERGEPGRIAIKKMGARRTGVSSLTRIREHRCGGVYRSFLSR